MKQQNKSVSIGFRVIIQSFGNHAHRQNKAGQNREVRETVTRNQVIENVRATTRVANPLLLHPNLSALPRSVAQEPNPCGKREAEGAGSWYGESSQLATVGSENRYL